MSISPIKPRPPATPCCASATRQTITYSITGITTILVALLAVRALDQYLWRECTSRLATSSPLLAASPERVELICGRSPL